MVKDNIDWEHPVMKELMDIISEYAMRYNLEKYDGKLVSLDQVEEVRKQLPAEAEILAAVTSLAVQRAKPGEISISNYINEHKDAIVNISEATLVAYRIGEEGWYVEFNNSDPLVSKAREMVRLDLLLALKAN